MVRSTIAEADGRGGINTALMAVEANVRSMLGESAETKAYLNRLLAYFEAAEREGVYEPKVTFVMELDDLYTLKRVLLEHPRLSGQRVEGGRRQARK